MGSFLLFNLFCFALKNYSGVPLLVCVTVVVSLKWLAVPIMTSQSKTTAKEFLKPSYNVQRESLDMTYKSQNPLGLGYPPSMGSTVKIFTFDLWIKIQVIIGTPKKMCDQKPNVFQGRLLLGLKNLTHLVIFEHVDVV